LSAGYIIKFEINSEVSGCTFDALDRKFCYVITVVLIFGISKGQAVVI